MRQFYLITLLALSSGLAVATQSFTVSARGRTYTITTQAIGTAVTFGGHWMYEPSVILPSALTSNQYYLLFNSNLVAGQGLQGEAIFLSTSSTPTGFSAPTPILKASDSSNICDMIDARPIWDGSKWHVYVQAVVFNGSVCPTVGPNGIYEATGTSLSAGVLKWVTTGGTAAKQIVTSRSSTGVGIGESHQWFNTASYGGPSSQPLMDQYNDWNYTGQDCCTNPPCPTSPPPVGCAYCCYTYCPLCNFNGTDSFFYLSPDGTNTLNFWYYRQTPWSSPTGALFLDAILANDLDQSTNGNPGIAFSASCGPAGADLHYSYTRGIGFYNDPMPYNASNGTTRAFQGGAYYDGPTTSGSFEGTVNVTINGVLWARLFSPRIARNEHGYIVPTTNSPKTWITYVYYNDQQINQQAQCGGYTNWAGSTQGFAATKLTITEQ